jgi:PAS domain-containing protein
LTFGLPDGFLWEGRIEPKRRAPEVNTPLPTEFLPAERGTAAELQRGAGIVRAERSFREALQLVPNLVVVLDSHRQIVFANPGETCTPHRTKAGGA